jgi:hopanoid biosynthesis associated protein HpnK
MPDRGSWVWYSTSSDILLGARLTGAARDEGSTQIILNADDFGRSAGINAAVMEAHRRGVLTSASLMVMGDAVEEAVILARDTPTLAVGLHVVVAAGRAALPHGQIPHIVDHSGYFPGDPFRIGLRYFFSRMAQEELSREMEAQFDRFAATGLALSHVDGHLHMHVHPTVLSLLLPLAVRYGAHGLRVPRDDYWLALGYDRHRAGINAVQAIVFGLLCRRCARSLASHNSTDGDKRYPLVAADRVYGLMQTGQMQEAYVLRVLRRLRVPTAELYFHPSRLPEGEPLGPNPGDLAALLSPAVRQTIQEQGLSLATYPTLGME